MDWENAIRSEFDGMTPYSPGLRVSEVRERSGKDTILKLSSNEHPCGPFPRALEAMRIVLPRLNRYPDGASAALEGALCEKLGVDARHLVIGNGSNELLRLLAQVLVRPGDEIVFAWPSFVVYPMLAQMFGAAAIKVPLDDQEVHDLDAMLGAVTDRTRLMFLCNPNNPTGTIYTRDAFESFLERLPDHVVLAVDEAYFEFVTDAEYPDALEYFDGSNPLVVLRTFSKIYSLAGARIGYAVMPEQVVEALDKVREPFNVNSVAQIGAYYSLLDEAEVIRRRAENQEQKMYLYSCFDRLGVTYVRSETNFVYFKTDRPVEVFEALLRQGIIARDFGTAPALRIGIGTPDDMRLVGKGFGAVAEELGSI